MFSSDEDVAIPARDLVSYAFENVTSGTDEPVYIDAYDPTKQLTAREARKDVRRLVGGLQEIGMCRGDAVCVHSFNHLWYSTLYLGIIGAGGLFVGSNPAYTSRELKRLLTVSKTKFIFVQPGLLKNVMDVARECDIPHSRIVIIDHDSDNLLEANGCSTLKTLLHSAERDWVTFNDEAVAKQTPATLLWTSGTGGLPKAAVMSHHALVSQSVLSEWTGRKVPYKVRRLVCLALSHSFVLPYNISPLREGHQTYIMGRFNRDEYVEFIRKYQVTSLAIVPPIAMSVFGNAGISVSSLSSLREIICAGAPLKRETQLKLSQNLDPQVRLVQLWGMSELGWLTAFAHPERDETGSVGRLLPNTRATLLDENGVEVIEECKRGELYIKNTGTMSGYLDDSATSISGFLNGWFRTGDIGYCRDGKWCIVDRAKDLLKVRAWQVSPAELEACLLEHPCIKDAAVIGVDAGDGSGELPLAWVVVKEGIGLRVDEQTVKDYVKQRLAKYKALDGGVRFIETIPRTISGKILRRVLREMAKEEMAKEESADVK